MFITMRMADSLPKEVVLRLEKELENWLLRNGLPLELVNRATNDGNIGNARLVDQIPKGKQSAFRRIRDSAWHRSLDECHGRCLLEDSKLARIVAEALLFYDGSKYDLDSLVVMPNHVHTIVQFRSHDDFSVVNQSWMRYTARQINIETGDSGEFWQREPFDHLIRSPDQFDYLHRYIAENPIKANLPDGKFLYWNRRI